MKPTDILADDQSEALFDGKKLRKGTIAAFLANLKILKNSSESSEAYQVALSDAKSLFPDVQRIGVFDYLTFKDSNLQKIFK